MAFINAPLPTVTPRRFPSASISRRTLCRVDSAPPPETRYAKYYPSRGRFYAPRVRLTNVTDLELLNRLDLSNEEVDLDEKEAANLLRALGWLQVATRGDWGALFTSEETSAGENVDAVERYYPRERRYEVPMIQFNETLDAMSVSVGKLADAEAVEREKMKEQAAPAGAFWKQAAGTPGVVQRPATATQIIDKYFPTSYRNLAPVVEFATGELGVQVSMQEIRGGPDDELYSENYDEKNLFYAPEIRMQAPQGEWDDTSGFLEVASTEVQLPLLETARLPLHPEVP